MGENPEKKTNNNNDNDEGALPTLFMELPILVLTLRNLLKSQRGTFTTQ